MEDFSVFDIIGPRMTGPSSSHTAGAVRLAHIARKIAGEDVAEAAFTLYGSFAETGRGHGTDKALVAGALGMDTDAYHENKAKINSNTMTIRLLMASKNPDATPEELQKAALDLLRDIAGGKVDKNATEVKKEKAGDFDWDAWINS